MVRHAAAERAVHRLLLKVERLRGDVVKSLQVLPGADKKRSVGPGRRRDLDPHDSWAAAGVDRYPNVSRRSVNDIRHRCGTSPTWERYGGNPPSECQVPRAAPDPELSKIRRAMLA